MVPENSSFMDEGKNLLIEEFGKNYATYFSILSAISGGINTQPEIESALGNKSIGGQLKRLIEDYNIIERQRPILLVYLLRGISVSTEVFMPINSKIRSWKLNKFFYCVFYYNSFPVKIIPFKRYINIICI